MNNTISSINLKRNYLSFKVTPKKLMVENDTQGAVAISDAMSKNVSNALKSMVLAGTLLLPVTISAQSHNIEPAQSGIAISDTDKVNDKEIREEVADYLNDIAWEMRGDKRWTMSGVQSVAQTLGNSELSDKEKISRIGNAIRLAKKSFASHPPAGILLICDKMACMQPPAFALTFFGIGFGVLSCATIFSTLNMKSSDDKYRKTSAKYAAILALASVSCISSGVILDKNIKDSQIEGVATMIVNQYNQIEQKANIPEFSAVFKQTCEKYFSNQYKNLDK